MKNVIFIIIFLFFCNSFYCIKLQSDSLSNIDIKFKNITSKIDSLNTIIQLNKDDIIEYKAERKFFDSSLNIQTTIYAVLFTVAIALFGILVPYFANRSVTNQIQDQNKRFKDFVEKFEKNERLIKRNMYFTLASAKIYESAILWASRVVNDYTLISNFDKALEWLENIKGCFQRLSESKDEKLSTEEISEIITNLTPENYTDKIIKETNEIKNQLKTML